MPRRAWGWEMPSSRAGRGAQEAAFPGATAALGPLEEPCEGSGYSRVLLEEALRRLGMFPGRAAPPASCRFTLRTGARFGTAEGPRGGPALPEPRGCPGVGESALFLSNLI